MRSWRSWLLSVLGVCSVVVVLWLVLDPVTHWMAGPVVRSLPAEAQAAAVNAVRQTLLQALGGTAALSALVFTARTYLLNRTGQFSERYAVAIGQLASDRLAERIGGIYALEHLMRESERDHVTVVEVLAAFVRENRDASRAPGRPLADTQVALTVIGRRPIRPELHPVDLNGADLRWVNLHGARLGGARLEGANLESAILKQAQLEGASLTQTRLGKANLRLARLEGANLEGANLSQTRAHGAHLEGANLLGATLDRAVFEGAHLENANLKAISCDRTNFKDAHLKDAELDIQYGEPINLTDEQRASAITKKPDA